MTSTEYHRILGLGPGASKPEIKRAFRRLALQYHPDVNSDLGAAERFLIIVEAYQVLFEGKPSSRPHQTAQEFSQEERLKRAREVAKQAGRERAAIEKAFYERIKRGYLIKYAHLVSFLFIVLALLTILNYFLPYQENPTVIKSKAMHYFYHLQEDRAFVEVCDHSYRILISAFFNAKRGDSVVVEVSSIFNDVMNIRFETGGVKYVLHPHESLYTYFPLVPVLMLIPFLNLIFMEPDVRFYIIFFLTVFLGTAFLFYIFLDGGRITRILEGFPC